MAKVNSPLATEDNTWVEYEDNFKFNAPHHFKVNSSSTGKTICRVDFQEGPIKEYDLNGVFNEDLIMMVITRLEHFQDSEFACHENLMVLDKLNEAMMWLRKRTLDRQSRGVQGIYKK